MAPDQGSKNHGGGWGEGRAGVIFYKEDASSQG